MVHNAKKTHCQYGHKFTLENTYVYPRTGRRACRVCLRAHARRWAATHPEEERDRASRYYEATRSEMIKKSRDHKLARRYGLTAGSYNELLESQKGRCAICGNLPDTRRLSVDHDHETGVVRGLLCSHCNTGLGQFRDNAKLLNNAIGYLSSHIWASNPTPNNETSM